MSVRTAGAAAPQRRRMNFGLDRFSGLYLWALFIVVFGVWTPSEFLTTSNAQTIASEQAVAAMVGLAVLDPLAAGLYDLSVGATANLTGILAVVLMNNDHVAVVPAILVAVAVGVAIGLINAVIVVKLGVSSFIATLGMGSILSAAEVIISANSRPNPPASAAWNNLTQTSIGGFQIIVVYLILLALLLWWLLAHTPGGRYLYAIGGNPESARLSGVRVNVWTAVALTTSASVAGLAGVLFTSQSGPALTFGPTLLLPAFAAAFLGSTQLQPGKFNVWGTLIAIYVLATGVQGLQLVSGAVWLNDMFNGVALIIAVALSVGAQAVSLDPQVQKSGGGSSELPTWLGPAATGAGRARRCQFELGTWWIRCGSADLALTEKRTLPHPDRPRPIDLVGPNSTARLKPKGTAHNATHPYDRTAPTPPARDRRRLRGNDLHAGTVGLRVFEFVLVRVEPVIVRIERIGRYRRRPGYGNQGPPDLPQRAHDDQRHDAGQVTGAER
jgi:ribose transport system permease protein